MDKESLWGDIPLDIKLETPLSILKQQAVHLNEATKGLLSGRVQVLETQKLEEIGHGLRVVSPALANYYVSIAAIAHKISLYPVRVYSYVADEWIGEAASPEQLRELLKTIFQNEATQRILQALISQSTDESLLTKERKRRPRVDIGGHGVQPSKHSSSKSRRRRSS